MLFNRRRGIVWIGALLLALLSMDASAAAQGQSQTALEGTFWAGTDSDGLPFVFEFKSSGKFRYVPVTGVVRKGNWKKIGDSIEMFSGTNAKDVLSGEASSKRGLKWKWSATKQPLVLSNVAPTYPAIAAAARVRGNVILELKIGAAGDVLSACVISGHPLLVQASVLAGRQWKFAPVAGNDQVRVARVIFSFRTSVGAKVSKNATAVFASPYQALVSPTPTVDQVNYSVAKLR
jgi:TonB family protein